MPHVLAQVRSAAVAVLTGLTTTGPRVYVQEPYPWTAAQVPGLIVTTSAQPTVLSLDVPAELDWPVEIDVECVTRGLGDLVTQLDLIATEVQVALCGLITLGGKPVSVVPTALAPPQFSGDGDQPVARRTLSFVLQSLQTAANAPDTLI